MKPGKIRHFYYCSCAALLCGTGLAKLYAGTGTARILLMTDPLFGISNRALMLSVGLVEVGIAAYLIIGKTALLRSISLFWISSNFMFYRVASDFMDVEVCPCLGTLMQELPFSKKAIETGLMLVVLYFFLGSGWLLLSGSPSEDTKEMSHSVGPELKAELATNPGGGTGE